MRASPLRLSAIAAVTALALGALGLGWHALHFGLTDAASAARVELDVRQLITDRTRQVRSLAERVAGDGALVERAALNSDSLGPLFTHLELERERTTDFARVSITVYTKAVAGGYRVLAWSDGAAEDLEADRLSGPPALFATRGTGGLMLHYIQPIEVAGRRVGTAAAETVLAAPSPEDRGAEIATPLGAVTLYPGAPPGAGEAGAFDIASSTGEPLIHVRYRIEDLARERRQGFQRVGAMAAVPLTVLVLLLTGSLVARRARARRPSRYFAWSALAAALVAIGAAALAGLAAVFDAPSALTHTLLALAALAAATLLPVSLWWWPWPRRRPADAPRRFAIEHLLAGIATAGFFLLLVQLSSTVSGGAATWRPPLFPVAGRALGTFVGRLLMQVAVCWTLAAVPAVLASRWRLSWRTLPMAVLSIVLWMAPSAVAVTVWPDRSAPAVAWIPLAAALAAFALAATPLRTYYRHTTQAMRLVLVFLALFVPTLVMYPRAALEAESVTRQTIEREYSPIVAEMPQRARQALASAQSEIDAVADLDVFIAAAVGNPVKSRVAFTIWNRTSLSLTRATSDIELYGPDGALVSRFALNIPEYTSNTSSRRWQGTGCSWQTFDETRRLGTEERRVFRAERGVCGAGGGLLGAVAVHVVLDYQALPFIASANPYADVLAPTATSTDDAHPPDLQVVVYGWSLYPLAPYGQVAWPITDDVFSRLYASRDPFWTVSTAADRRYRVRFTSDRTGIYAIGYPIPTMFEHAAGLAESGAITGVLFVLFLVGAAIYGPFAARRQAPLRVLFHEIRTSFYRKLFLFFVFAAVVPVLMFALAFGAYMQSKFRADVISEATTVVTVARRVLEELAAAAPRPNGTPAPPTDDVMVWIGQVTHQHVNLFEGSQLKATSQRDLFESGLLPVRTPAAAYREIALQRLPTAVKEDSLGTFHYQVAAAPVPAYGWDSVLSVPLATRQREIEQQTAELNRGVLVGAVVVVLFAAGLGASVAGRIADPVSRLTRATRQIAAGDLGVRIVADTADELRRLVDDFNSMAATLESQRAALARTNQLKAWNEMARQVAHEIKNPLTPIQLSAEHLQRVHEDARRPLGAVFDQCVTTILKQVRLLRQIAAEFSNFAGEPTPRPADVDIRELVEEVVAAYRTGPQTRMAITVAHPAETPIARVDRTLIARALTNVVENALHAMPTGGTLDVTSATADGTVVITLTDTGVGMDAEAVTRAFEPYFSTRTAGSGLGLANAKRNIELCGGTIRLASVPGRGTTVRVTLPAAARSAAPSIG